jgi:hypothetical protein
MEGAQRASEMLIDIYYGLGVIWRRIKMSHIFYSRSFHANIRPLPLSLLAGDSGTLSGIFGEVHSRVVDDQTRRPHHYLRECHSKNFKALAKITPHPCKSAPIVGF